MEENNPGKHSSEETWCPVFKQKNHCSQLDGTEASGLPKEKWHEFCLNKCPIYKRHKANINKG